MHHFHSSFLPIDRFANILQQLLSTNCTTKDAAQTNDYRSKLPQLRNSPPSKSTNNAVNKQYLLWTTNNRRPRGQACPEGPTYTSTPSKYIHTVSQFLRVDLCTVYLLCKARVSDEPFNLRIEHYGPGQY